MRVYHKYLNWQDRNVDTIQINKLVFFFKFSINFIIQIKAVDGFLYYRFINFCLACDEVAKARHRYYFVGDGEGGVNFASKFSA